MRCLFCKQPSDTSSSIEHIIPESLGNKDHVLPKGWVCDACNNYFSRKVEKPFLESSYGVESRFRRMVSNKLGNYPFVRGLHLQTLTPIQLSYAGSDSSHGIEVLFSEKAVDFLTKMKPGEKGSLITPCTPEPTNGIATARFIAKMGLEILAHRLMDSPGANNELVDKPELGAIRNYARRGEPTILWPVSIRRIYPESFLFTSDSPVPYEVLHEFDLLCTTGSEYYAVVAIFGFEYVINLGGPDLDGYQEWLKTNNMKSPLYCGKNISQKGQAKDKGPG